MEISNQILNLKCFFFIGIGESKGYVIYFNKPGMSLYFKHTQLENNSLGLGYYKILKPNKQDKG